VSHRCRPASCSGCPFEKTGTDFSRVEGTGVNGVLLVGEASGEHEARECAPFRPFAPAGGVLERCLRRMGLDRQQFAVTNACRCRPNVHNWLDGHPAEYAALRHCRPNLDQAIADYRPRSIVSLGGVALRELTGEAGEARGVTHLAGYVMPLAGGNALGERYRQEARATLQKEVPPESGNLSSASAMLASTGSAIPVLANFHPSYLRRGKASHQGVFSRIIQRGLAIASGRDRAYMWGVDPNDPATWQQPSGERLQYWTKPTLDQARSFYYYLRDNSGLPFAADLETSESSSLDEDAREGFSDTNIRLAQFSYQPGTGIALPWEDGFKEIAQAILHLPNKRYMHNGDNFDHKVLRACAAREGWRYAPTERIYDTLDLFHHWQPDLPAHLQFAASFVAFPFPWKHLATTNIEFYGISDVDATLRLGVFLEAALKKDNLWGEGEAYSLTLGYTGQEREVRPVLAAMEDRGVPIDDAKRIELGAEFEKAQVELGAELDRRFPDECRSLHPKEGYKKVPKDCAGLVERDFNVPDIDSETGEPRVVVVRRWCRPELFAPNSSQQLLRYMRHHGHKVPKSKIEDDEGNQKDTTAKKELMRLARKVNDTFYLKVIEYREFSKLRGTYVDGFKPAADGRVHTTFTFDTGIGQLSSRNPNVQNFIKHGRLAKAMRAIVAAKPGRVLTEWDFKSCHVLTLGLLAEDANYIRCARIDMHSLMTGHYLKLWDIKKILSESDEELLARCKWLKSNPEYKHIRDSKIKHAGLGIGNGLKAKGLFERYMEFFSGQKEAAAILSDYEAVFTPVFDWQRRIQMQAHEQQKLVTQFGHIRRFYEVFRWDSRKGAWGHGDQAEEAIAFWLANIAFGHIREKLKELHRLGLDSKYNLINNVHDSFIFEPQESMLEEHCAEVYPVLVAPSKVLKHPTICPDGLVIGVDGAWGYNWSEMKSIGVEGSGNAIQFKMGRQEDSPAIILGEGRQVSGVGATR